MTVALGDWEVTVGMGRDNQRSRTTVAAPAGRPPGTQHEVIQAFSRFVPLLQAALGVRVEVVLHDLRLLPNSIVAISGDVTGRRIGGPATDVLLDLVREGSESSLISYRTEYPEGRPLRSSTLLIRDGTGAIIGALCINADISDWVQVRDVVESLLGDTRARWPSPQAVPPSAAVRMPAGERFATNVSDLASYLVERAIADQGVPVDLMRKEHKLRAVRTLEREGLFEIRDAVPMVARSLRVSRFTIYNYLKELGAAPPRTGGRASAG